MVYSSAIVFGYARDSFGNGIDNLVITYHPPPGGAAASLEMPKAVVLCID